MKEKFYIRENQVERFEIEASLFHPNYKPTKWTCACGESMAYIDDDAPDAPVVIVCDSCHKNATYKEQYY